MPRNSFLPVPTAREISEFCLAAQNGDLDNVATLLWHYHDNIVNEKDRTNMTALAWAARGGHLAIINLLLDSGASIDEGSFNRDCSALAWAAYKGHEEAVVLLLKRGASPDKANSDGETAAMIAETHGYPAIADLIETWVSSAPLETPSTDKDFKKVTEEHLEKLKNLRLPKPPLKKGPFPKP